MKFIHRLGYYLGGFSLGLIILAFFLSGKRSSCNYFPDARVMQDIREKQRVYSEEALQTLQLNNIDTSEVSKILYSGDINFGKSNTNAAPCNLYLVTGETQDRILELLFQNCDSTATLQKVNIQK